MFLLNDLLWLVLHVNSSTYVLSLLNYCVIKLTFFTCKYFGEITLYLPELFTNLHFIFIVPNVTFNPPKLLNCCNSTTLTFFFFLKMPPSLFFFFKKRRRNMLGWRISFFYLDISMGWFGHPIWIFVFFKKKKWWGHFGKKKCQNSQIAIIWKFGGEVKCRIWNFRRKSTNELIVHGVKCNFSKHF